MQTRVDENPLARPDMNTDRFPEPATEDRFRNSPSSGASVRSVIAIRLTEFLGLQAREPLPIAIRTRETSEPNERDVLNVPATFLRLPIVQ